MSINNTNLGERRYKVVTTKGVHDVISSDSDNDDHPIKPKVLLGDQFRSDSAHKFRRRAEKVWAVSTKQDESQKLAQESSPEEKVGDTVRLGGSSYFVIDIFEKEIMELGDKVDLNYTKFEKFKVIDGDAPRNHHFYYNQSCCDCGKGNVEREWGGLKRELDSKENQHGSRGVTIFARTYTERKELMRVAITATKGEQSQRLFFFDIKFPKEYPYEAPSFYYHRYNLPLSTHESQKQLRPRLGYGILDVFHHIEEIVLMNTNKSCQHMLDMLKHPLTGFEDFVKGHFRKKGALILQKLMDDDEEFDMETEKDKDMFWKMYIAFEDNRGYCEHLLNNDLKEELKIFKEKECSLNEHYYSSSSTSFSSHSYFPTMINRFDDIQKTSKFHSFWSKFSLL
ncbi:unnamed protein product [Cochlearia groenlandica]